VIDWDNAEREHAESLKEVTNFGAAKAARRKKQPPPATANDNRPRIQVIAGDLTRVVDDAEAALIAADLGIYQRSTEIVRPGTVHVEIRTGGKAAALRIMALGEHALVEVLTLAAHWEKYDARAEKCVPINAPNNIAKTLSERVGRWKLPVLTGIIGAPTLRKDGSILSTPGYDPETGLILDLSEAFDPIPENPTEPDAIEAMNVLNDLIDSFKHFVSQADRSVALSALLTASIRHALRTAPMHAFTAPTAGSGKSKLADLCSIMVTGRDASVIGHGGDRIEFEKRLASQVLAGEPIIAIDNVETEIGGEFLCQILTQTSVSPRKLGKSEAPAMLSNSFITCNGNNLQLAGDVTRRTIRCALDPKCERPELRHFDSDVCDTMRDNRSRYLVAALTVLRAFHNAGRPQKTKPDGKAIPDLGSFVEWSRWVRGALLWLGYADPCLTMEDIRASDPRLAETTNVLEQWHTVIGTDEVSTAEVIERATSQFQSMGFTHPEFREALLVVAGAGGAVNSRKLGNWLGAVKGKIVKGHTIQLSGRTGGMTRWKMFAV